MPILIPNNAQETCALLREASTERRTLRISGNNSKSRWGGPVAPSDDVLSTTALNRVLEYEHNDLTVSVEAGMPFAQLQGLLASHKQMIALDPPHANTATVGGVISANSSGTMRRRYGTARDLVIGMTFATTGGKLVASGGRVVKNVAGLDMGKLLIGSFGSLAAVTSVNFRIHPKPDEWWTFLYSFSDLQSALLKGREVLQSSLRPVAMELLNPSAGARLGFSHYTLAIRAAGSRAVLGRYARELDGSDGVMGHGEEKLWEQIREFAPDYLNEHGDGILLRCSGPAVELGKALELAIAAGIYRCGTGLLYFYCAGDEQYRAALKVLANLNCRLTVEACSEQARQSKAGQSQSVQNNDRREWQSEREPSNATLVMMKKLKMLFDPNSVLSPMRVYDGI